MAVTSRSCVIVVLLALASASHYGSGPQAIAAAQDDTPRIVDVVVRRFAFEPAEIQATVGERIRLRVMSADGPHGVQISQLNIKKEVPRGEVVLIDITPENVGEFPVLCSEYCGSGHADRKGTLIVSARAETVQ